MQFGWYLATRMPDWWKRLKPWITPRKSPPYPATYPDTEVIAKVRFFQTDDITIDTLWVEITEVDGTTSYFSQDNIGFTAFVHRLGDELPLKDYSSVFMTPFLESDCVAYDRAELNKAENDAEAESSTERSNPTS